MTEQVLDAFVTVVINASDYEEMDRIYLKPRYESHWRRRAKRPSS